MTNTLEKILHSGKKLAATTALSGALLAPQANGSIIFNDSYTTFGNPQSVVYKNGEAITGADFMVGTGRYDASNLAAGPLGNGPNIMSGALGADISDNSIYTINGSGIINQEGNPGFNYGTTKINPTGLALFGNDNGMYGAVLSGTGANTILTIIQPDATQTDYNLGVNRQGLTPFVHNDIAYVLTTNSNRILQYELGSLSSGGLENPSLNLVGEWSTSGLGTANDIYARSLGGRDVEFYAVNGIGVSRSEPFQLVPTPGSAALLGLAGLAGTRRRRRAA